MTRHLYILILCLFSTMFSALAEQQEEFVLSEANNFTHTINFNNLCEFTVKRIPGNNPDVINLSFGMRNTSDQGIILFKHNYYKKKNSKEDKESWKDLKNIFYEIKTNNQYFKTNGVEGVSPRFLTENVFIDINDSIDLPMRNFQCQESTINVKVPIHQCLIERKKNVPKKFTVIGVEDYSITIKVELGPDTIFESLKEECEQYLKDIDKATFCINAKHPTSVEEQFKVYTDRHQSLVMRIRNHANKRDGLLNKDLTGTKYGDLIQQLNDAVKNKQKTMEEKKCFKDCNKPPCGNNPKTCTTCGAVITKCPHGGNHPTCTFKGCKKIIDKGHRVNKKKRCPYDGGKHPDPIPNGKTIKSNLVKIYKDLDNSKNKKEAKAKAINKAKPWYNNALKLPDTDTYKQGCIDTYNKIINYKI